MTDINYFKYSTYVVNILVFLKGLASLAVGMRLAILAHSYIEIAEVENSTIETTKGFSVLYAIYFLAIAIGLILMVTGFVGCCGTLKENQLLRAIFGVSVLAFFVLQVVCGFLLWLFYPQIRKKLLGSMLFYNIKYRFSAEGQAVYEGWLMLQNALNCCGVTGSQDWTLLAGVHDPPPPCTHLIPFLLFSPVGREEVLKKHICLIVGIVCIRLLLEIVAMMFAVSNIRSKRRITNGRITSIW